MDDSSSSRPVFYLSDRTGITARTLGHALLTQFQSIPFTTHTLPFINSPRRALRAVETINLAAAGCGCKALVFSTLLDTEIKSIIADSNAIVFDYFSAFISPLEKELHADSSQITGLSHGIDDDEDYMQRMEALNFTLSNDDGANTHQYPAADIILVGASRSAKTPSCLYLALQFGLNAANYPLTGKDLTSDTLPAALKPHRKKLLGLTISPERLHRIRQKRRPDSDYASLRQCQKEIRAIEAIYHNEKVRYLDTSAMSVEEIATTIVQITHS